MRLRDVGPGALVFCETREDLVAGLDGEGRSWIDHTRLRGLSVRGSFGPGRSCHRSDPDPDEAQVLAGLVVSGSTPAEVGPAEGQGVVVEDPVGTTLDPEQALGWLGIAIEPVVRQYPQARVRAFWVGHVQVVLVGRPDRGVETDRRDGARLRLEAALPGAQGLAVVESACGPEPDATARFLAGELVERTHALRGARRMPSGAWPVVFAPGVGGVLLHEIVGHALEGDVLEGGQSWLSGASQAGSTVAPAGVRVIDDPRRGRSACRIDDEGETARPVALVAGGRVVGRLDDLARAWAGKRAPSGHGRRASYREPVLPRMGCTFLAPGRLEPEEVWADVKDGLYVRRLEAASTDPPTGRAVFRVTDANRIRDGKLDGPLAPLLLQVEAPVALLGLDRVARDLEFDRCTGSCVRDGQALSTSVGGPTCRIGLANVVA
jgi:TldD protein